MIHFTVPAVPVAQPRQRHRAVKGKDGRTFATNYTPAKDPVNAYKASVRLAAAEAYDGPPLEGPLAVSLLFVLPRPKSLIWKTKLMPRLWHGKKPDRDNLVKSTLDALTGLLWRDDCQVCRGGSCKVIASGDEQPHVRVTVAQLDDWVREQVSGGEPLHAIEEALEARNVAEQTKGTNDE